MRDGDRESMPKKKKIGCVLMEDNRYEDRRSSTGERSKFRERACEGIGCCMPMEMKKRSAMTSAERRSERGFVPMEWEDHR